MPSRVGWCRPANSLETAATHHVRLMELTEHYRTEMALRYLPIRYETMVTRQAETVRSTLDFIGAPFDRSLHRDQHYRRHLEPVIAILRPLIERLGYTAD